MGSSLANIRLLHRFLSGIVGVVILSVMSAFMLCVLLAGGFAVAGFSLIHFGLDPYVAVIALTIVAFIIAIVLVALTMARIRELRDLSSHYPSRSESGIRNLPLILDAFIDGFLNHKE